MISKIEKITIYVDSQEDAKAFWTEVMGFVVTAEEPMGPGAMWLEVSPQQGIDCTAIVLYSKRLMQDRSPESVAHPSIIFGVDDIYQLWQKMQQYGVETSEIQQYSFGKMFDFRDNEGNPYMVRGV
jgi:catechol 2,3-dioxygenase-like lactoylglutathione lyase family enzyme